MRILIISETPDFNPASIPASETLLKSMQLTAGIEVDHVSAPVIYSENTDSTLHIKRTASNLAKMMPGAKWKKDSNRIVIADGHETARQYLFNQLAKIADEANAVTTNIFGQDADSLECALYRILNIRETGIYVVSGSKFSGVESFDCFIRGLRYQNPQKSLYVIASYDYHGCF